jgi:hypothetical protein
MRIFLLLAFVSLVTFAADNKLAKTCEKEALDRYPVPNFNPQQSGLEQMKFNRGTNNYLSAVPTAADNESARKKREQYFNDCINSADQ